MAAAAYDRTPFGSQERTKAMRDSLAVPRRAWSLLAIALTACACSRPASAPNAIRLVDAFDAKLVEGSPPKATAAAVRRTEWRFDGPAPSPAPSAFPATRGFEAGPGVSGLAVRDGVLIGHTTAAFPVLHLERTTGLENADQLQAVE